MSRALLSAIAACALAGILAGANMVADTRLATTQLDLTQDHAFTLSAGTRHILAGLKEPITLRLYMSRALGVRIPAYGAYAARVREMLLHYARASHGMVRVRFLDPLPYSAVEDQALAAGLQAVPLNRAGEQVYFGLAGSNLLDSNRAIPFFDPARARFLEYDLTKLVWELSMPKRPLIGVMSTLPIDGNMRLAMQTNGQRGGPWAVMLQLRQSFDVQDIPTTATAIPKGVKVLMVVHPQHLALATQYAIDQFVMRGGRLMLMLDPHSDVQDSTPGPGGQPPADTTSTLHRLLTAWGIAYNPRLVIGDLTGAARVQSNPGDRLASTDYVAWFGIQGGAGGGIAPNDPATAELTRVNVATPGTIAPAKGATIAFTPLLQTDTRAAPIPLSSVSGTPDPAGILARFRPTGKRYVIAARIRGMLHSAFTGAPAGALPGVKGAPAYRAATAHPADMVVIADTDLLANRFWVQVRRFFGQTQATPFADNGALVANLVGTLAGGDALLSLRGRGIVDRPFTVVDRMQRAAEARFRRTEHALQTHLNATRARLTALRTGQGRHRLDPTLGMKQELAIARLEQDAVATRVKLRRVQFDLRRDIAALESRLRFLDIAAVPLVLTVLALGLALVRRRRRTRSRA